MDSNIYEYNKKSHDINKGTSILLFTATWCGPCKIFKPIYREIAKEYPEYVFYFVDVDKNQDLCEKFDISSIPVIHSLKDGKVINEKDNKIHVLLGPNKDTFKNYMEYINK